MGKWLIRQVRLEKKYIRAIITNMNKFTSGGARPRKEFVGGRPKSDVNNYAPKKRFDNARRDDRGDGRFNPKDRAPRPVQLFQTTCTTCGKPCEVPFRPDGTKPVLCRDCFAQKTTGTPQPKNDRDDRFERPVRQFESSSAKSVDLTPLTKQISQLEHTLGTILKSIQNLEAALSAAKAQPVAETPVLGKVAVKKAPVKKVVKKVPAKKVAKKSAKKK